MTAQQFAVQVPFSNTGLQLGTSVGGPGASLTSNGDVLVDSVGVMDVQSKGSFLAQTNATLAMLSAATQKVHSQGKVEVFAGGGRGPSACGLAAPNTPSDSGAPASASEKVTDLACAALGAVSAGYGIRDAWAAGGTGGKVIAVGVAGVAALGAGAAVAKAAGHAGGGADIVERASANIKMVAGKKISGLAPAMISAKTPGKYEVKALLVTDFTTTLFTNFALAKFEVKALDAFKTTSTMFDVIAEVETSIKTKDFKGKAALISMDGATTVTKTATVKGATHLHADLEVKRNALLTGALQVDGKTTVKGTLTARKNTRVESTMTVDGNVQTKTQEWKSRVTFGV